MFDGQILSFGLYCTLFQFRFVSQPYPKYIQRIHVKSNIFHGIYTVSKPTTIIYLISLK